MADIMNLDTDMVKLIMSMAQALADLDRKAPLSPAATAALAAANERQAARSGIQLGEYVIVRSQGAGVHVGTLASRDGSEALLTNCSRIWRWYGANTLSELSLTGPNRLSKTRISETVERNLILGVIEIIPVKAASSLFAPVWHD